MSKKLDHEYKIEKGYLPYKFGIPAFIFFTLIFYGQMILTTQIDNLFFCKDSAFEYPLFLLSLGITFDLLVRLSPEAAHTTKYIPIFTNLYDILLLIGLAYAATLIPSFFNQFFLDCSNSNWITLVIGLPIIIFMWLSPRWIGSKRLKAHSYFGGKGKLSDG